MDYKDAEHLVHFRELHFLPRVIFSIGAILLVGSFFVKLSILGFVGVGVIFVGSALNLVINTLLGFGERCKNKTVGIPWALLSQAVLALALAIITLSLTYYFYRHGEMPSYLRPLSNPH